MSATRSLQPLLRRSQAAVARGASAPQRPLLAGPVVPQLRRSLQTSGSGPNSSAPVLYSARARVVGARKGHVEGENLRVDLTMAKALGGPGDRGKTNPEELFAAGYGACFQSAMNACATQMGVTMPSNAQDSIVDATVHLVGDMKALDMGLRVDLKISVKGLERAKLEEVVERATKVCPYTRATHGNVETTFEIVDYEAGGGQRSGGGSGSTGQQGNQKPTDSLQDQGGYQ